MIPTYHSQFLPSSGIMVISPWWEKFNPPNQMNFDFQFTVKGTIKNYPTPAGETITLHDTKVHRFTCNCKDTFTEVYFWKFERENHDVLFVPNGKYQYDIQGLSTKLTDVCPVRYFAIGTEAKTGGAPW